MHQVFVDGGNEQMRRRGGCFKKRGGGFDRPLMVVIIVEGCEVDGKALQYHRSHTGLVGDRTFAFVVAISYKSEQNGDTTRAWNAAKIQSFRNIQSSGGSSRTGDRSPEHLACVRLPSHSDAWQQDKANVVIVLEPGAHGEVKLVR